MKFAISFTRTTNFRENNKNVFRVRSCQLQRDNTKCCCCCQYTQLPLFCCCCCVQALCMMLLESHVQNKGNSWLIFVGWFFLSSFSSRFFRDLLTRFGRMFSIIIYHEAYQHTLVSYIVSFHQQQPTHSLPHLHLVGYWRRS